jgi:hypothetical protein
MYLKLVAPGDITIYTTLCALATFPRASIKTRLLENTNFTLYMEHEPYIRDLIQAYMNSNFKVVLEILNRYSVCVLPHSYNNQRPDGVIADQTLHRCASCNPRPRSDKPDPELGSRTVLPAIRNNSTGSDECGVWMDGRRGRAASRRAHSEWPYSRSCGQSEQGVYFLLVYRPPPSSTTRVDSTSQEDRPES